MKLSSQEEYGLRCLLQLARQTPGESLSIPEISRTEDISHHNVAKLLRILRQGGLVDSARGQHGGYTLAKPPNQIPIADAIKVLGCRLFDDSFCDHFSGDGVHLNRIWAFHMRNCMSIRNGGDMVDWLSTVAPK